MHGEGLGLDDKGEKIPALFLVGGYKPETNSIPVSRIPLAWTYVYRKPYQKTKYKIYRYM